VYVEGGVEFTLSVRAVNNMGLHSDYLDITETSPDIGKEMIEKIQITVSSILSNSSIYI